MDNFVAVLKFLFSPYVAPIVILIIGWSVGRVKIRNHHARILQKEADLQTIRLHNIKYRTAPHSEVLTAHMLNASLVLSIDVFQRFKAAFKTMVGGEHSNYTDLLDRGRREALLRLKAQAQDLGAQDIYNIKIQSAGIAMGKGIEILAYGTAIKS